MRYLVHKIEEVKEQFDEAMDDDFNTANGIAALFELAQLANTYLIENNTSQKFLKHSWTIFDELDGCFRVFICE